MTKGICNEIMNFISKHFTNEWITTVGILISLSIGIYNIRQLRKGDQLRNDEMLFQNVIPKMKEILSELGLMTKNNNNNASTWSVALQQLSAFHNIAISLTDCKLRQMYCIELNAISLSLCNLMKNIDDSRFFYGIKNYTMYSNQDLFNESQQHKCHISLNVIGCILQFLSVFNGARGDYLSDQTELNKILKPIHYGWAEEIPNSQDVDNMMPPYKNMLSYVCEWFTYKDNSR